MEPRAAFAKREDAAFWFGQRRWYGEKDRVIDDLRTTFAASVELGGRELQIELVRIVFVGGDNSTYLLFRDPSCAGGDEQDCIELPEVRAWLMQGFRNGRVLAGSSGELRWYATEQLRPLAGAVASASKVFRGEQSNTSVVYRDQVMVKLFRKVRQGRNPEVEIGEHLTLNTDFTAFPRMLGTIDLVANGDVTTLACAQQYIPSNGDAWTWMLEGLVEPDFASKAIQQLNLLGRRTAELHAALALGVDPDFAPELIDADFAGIVYKSAREELEHTIDLLGDHGVNDVERLHDGLGWRLQDLRMLEGTSRIRIHGDYHLGQVLRTRQDDFAILDFEGEPTRSLPERRAKASPLRDAAGMLRSIDYLAESARRRAPEATGGGFESWRGAARRAFEDGYTTAVQASTRLSTGLDSDRRERLVAAFEVHKALYETRYELSNRPDWVDIPLRGLRRLAANSG